MAAGRPARLRLIGQRAKPSRNDESRASSVRQRRRLAKRLEREAFSRPDDGAEMASLDILEGEDELNLNNADHIKTGEIERQAQRREFDNPQHCVDDFCLRNYKKKLLADRYGRRLITEPTFPIDRARRLSAYSCMSSLGLVACFAMSFWISAFVWGNLLWRSRFVQSSRFCW